MTAVYFEHLGYIGRLGNALFQMAVTVALARRRGVRAVFNEDWLYRPYFQLPSELFGPPEGVYGPDLMTHLDQRCRVYMQDINLVEPVLPLVREYLKPSPLAQQVIAEHSLAFDELAQPVLSVHVRRTDNVRDPGVPDKHNYFVLPTHDYYKRAIDLLSPQCASVACFSDDPDWCVQNLDVDYVHHGVAHPKEHERDYLTAPVLDFIELQLMVRCAAHIVSGSTYGIWGALMADSPRVVRCTPVYGPKLAYIDEDLLFPTTWEVLPL